jgi:NitT/TauT family transport system substrate-binding protein
MPLLAKGCRFGPCIARLVAAALGAACISAAAGELRLAFSPNPGSLPIYVAQAQGLFAAEGLSLQPVECNVGKACLRQLLSGKADVATAADLPLVLAAFAGERFAVIATLNTNRNDTKIVARRSGHVTGTNDLAGRRVATVSGTTAQYALESQLLFDGVNPAAVDKIDLPVSELRPALLARRVDAVAIFEPMASEIAAALGGDAITMHTRGSYTQTWNLVGVQGGGSAGPERRRLLSALLKASDWIAAHPAEARALLQQRTGLSAELIEASWDALGYEVSLKQSLLVTLEAQARWARRERMVDAPPPNFLRFIDANPLRSLRPRAVTLAQ